MKHKIQYLLFALLLIGFQAFAQEEDNNDSKSNIQTYTPSKLLNKGQWDIKFFNNLYTENKFADANGKKQSKNHVEKRAKNKCRKVIANGKIYNIGDEKSRTRRKWAELYASCADWKFKFHIIPEELIRKDKSFRNAPPQHLLTDS